jgi:hypothetical protein
MERRDDRWHVGREIPIALIFALIVQTAGWIWWAATQSAKLDTLTAMVSEFKAAQYTQNDARRDQEINLGRDRDMARRIDMLEGDKMSRLRR